MIRLFNTYFPTRTLLLTCSEAILVTLGFIAAVLVSTGTAVDARIYLLYENGAGRIGLVVLVFLVLMYYFDLYNSGILTNRREVVTRLVGVLGCTFVALAVLYYTFPEASLGGTVLWIGVLVIAIAVPVWRSCFFMLNRSARFAESTVIYGDGPLAAPLMDAILQRPELGLRVAGYVGGDAQVATIPSIEPAELPAFVKREGVRRIIVTMGDRRGKLPVAELLKLKAGGVQIQDGPEYYETVTGKIPLESLRLELAAVFPWLSRAGRIAPLQAHVLALLRLNRRGACLAPDGIGKPRHSAWTPTGPMIFRQPRVGEIGEPFTVFKFRTMYTDGSRESTPA